MPVTLESQKLESQPRKPHILLVEDEVTSREHLAEVLADRKRAFIPLPSSNKRWP